MTKIKPKLLSLKVRCSCRHIETLEQRNFSFGGSEQACETCGHHGRVWLSFQCSYCNKWQQIELESW